MQIMRARTEENTTVVDELVLNQEDQPQGPPPGLKPISQLRFDYDTTTIRRYHDAIQSAVVRIIFTAILV